MIELPYFQNLKKSLRIIFQNPTLFVPTIISLMLSGIFSYFMQDWMPMTTFELKPFLVVMGFGLVSMAVNFLLWGWTFGLLEQWMKKKKLDLGLAWGRKEYFSWLFLKIGLIFFAVFGVIYLLVIVSFVLTGVFMKLNIIGTIFGVLFGILAFSLALGFIALCFFALILGLQLAPVLIAKNQNATGSIKSTYYYIMSHKTQSFKYGVLSILLVLVIEIGSLVLGFIFGWVTFGLGKTSVIYTSVLGVIMMVVSLAIIVAYCRDYKQK